MEKTLLVVAFWVLFLGGLFGVAMGMTGYFAGKTATEYGVMGIGGGAFLVWSAVVALIRSKMQ
jgi:hypothetical protein